ncbi:ABC transporter ATP-binding protein [Haloglycomyces albus]|uniref:ABC transporter ATP-binding protein n=1 Tax=Haloglycomyces albus TaxID=526067 RepID=UPI00046CF4BF|nr:ABC transporter ATP-binding protein [Haloglycomyces albus]
MTRVIETENLVKRFGHVTALDNLNLHVAEGQTHGFLGPNGAGKSTTIRVLLGMLRADGGKATLFGSDPWSQAPRLHRRLAYVPGDVNLWPSLSGGEIIDLLGRLRGGLQPRRRDELIDRFDLDPRKKAKSYSKGNRQKVALIAAFSSNVDLLLLDEPTSGLDPLMAAVFAETVREAAQEGTTVLLSSHVMSEVEQLCDNVSIIRQGSIVESGTLDDLRHLTRTQLRATVTQTPAGLAELDGVHDLTVNADTVRAHVDSPALNEVMERLTSAGITSLTVEPPSLEELFLRYYGDELAARGVNNGNGER